MSVFLLILAIAFMFTIIFLLLVMIVFGPYRGCVKIFAGIWLVIMTIIAGVGLWLLIQAYEVVRRVLGFLLGG